jgi:hypothetical protein
MKKFALLVVTLLSLSWTVGCEQPKPAKPADKPAEAAPAATAPAATPEKPADKPAEKAPEKK